MSDARLDSSIPARRKDIAMSSVRAPSRLTTLTAASIAAAFQLSSVTAGSLQVKPDISVTIFADHYVVEGRVIDDLDVLQKAVSSIGPGTVRLHACGRIADRAQRAAAHRFRTFSLELRLLEPKDAACKAIPAPLEIAASTRRGQRPFGIDDEVVDQWWHASMP
jgi:hypothetical protein